jgi:hypothetical protein
MIDSGIFYGAVGFGFLPNELKPDSQTYTNPR